jgi:hypothetical protein
LTDEYEPPPPPNALPLRLADWQRRRVDAGDIVANDTLDMLRAVGNISTTGLCLLLFLLMCVCL